MRRRNTTYDHNGRRVYSGGKYPICALASAINSRVAAEGGARDINCIVQFHINRMVQLYQ